MRDGNRPASPRRRFFENSKAPKEISRHRWRRHRLAMRFTHGVFVSILQVSVLQMDEFRGASVEEVEVAQEENR